MPTNGMVKLLIVEDDTDTQDLYARQLCNLAAWLDLTVDQAYNLDDALIKLKTSKYDCIMCDMNIPVIGGQKPDIAAGMEVLQVAQAKGISCRLVASSDVGARSAALAAGVGTSVTEKDNAVEALAVIIKQLLNDIEAGLAVRANTTPIIETVECTVCGELHKVGSKLYMSFDGNVTMGSGGGIVGNNLSHDGVVERSTVICAKYSCLSKLFKSSGIAFPTESNIRGTF